ncbi:MAG: hypothetical protein KDB18_09810, partial [Salinibacterium sp.]|nr:hypothetical protein [Salinibacterium sp.]
MALRMLQIVLPRGKEDDLSEIFEGVESDRYWSADIDENLSQISVVIPAEHVEDIADALSERFSVYSEFRLVILSIEATRPKLPDPEPPPEPPKQEPEQQPSEPSWKPLIGRISREELEEDLAQEGRPSAFFMTMVVLSTIVACVGLIKGSPAIIIGAMVIAPLL